MLRGFNCLTKHNILSCCEARSWNYQLPQNRVLGSMWQNEPAFKAFVWLLLKQNWGRLLVDVKALNYHRLKFCDMVVEVKGQEFFVGEKWPKLPFIHLTRGVCDFGTNIADEHETNVCPLSFPPNFPCTCYYFNFPYQQGWYCIKKKTVVKVLYFHPCTICD